MKKIQKMLLLIVASFMMLTSVSAAETLQSKIDAGEKTIVLDKNYNEEITIKAGQEVILDLNGYTLSGNIVDLGTLTIKSSKTGGKVILPEKMLVGTYDVNEKTNKVERELAGKFTLESGTIEVADDYGIYCMSGSTAIINGGEINSLFAPLSGNNTTGTMNFIITDGTLTAKKGPAIYMPGPVALTISGGILNGGVSLRMGKVNISGGTINATTGPLDSIVDYYDFSGSVWLANAVSVMGGTYTSKDEGTTNILDLNITGGTINVANREGSAVAIYDMGKVAQEMKVNISGNAKLITNSKTRNAYDVLTLTEAGVANIKTGYNNPEFVGKVSTVITGGTFSSSVAKYITSEYVETKVENEYVVAKKELKVDTPTIDTTKPVEEVTVGVKEDDTLKDTLEKAIKDSKIDVTDINAIVIVTIDNQKEEQVPEEASKSINELAKEKENIIVVSFFDITLNVKNNVTGETLGTLSTLDNKIKFNMALPEELTKVAEGYTRKYYVVRYHDGKSEIISASVDGNILSFESDKFSTYALAYEDVKDEVIVNPPTGDKIVLDLVVGIVSVAGLGLVAKSIAKRKKYFN